MKPSRRNIANAIDRHKAHKAGRPPVSKYALKSRYITTHTEPKEPSQ